jgi:hypothetical protein
LEIVQKRVWWADFDQAVIAGNAWIVIGEAKMGLPGTTDEETVHFCKGELTPLLRSLLDL